MEISRLLTLIGVSEFYNTQIDEMPLNVACVVFIYYLLRRVPHQLINDIVAISSRTRTIAITFHDIFMPYVCAGRFPPLIAPSLFYSFFFLITPKSVCRERNKNTLVVFPLEWT